MQAIEYKNVTVQVEPDLLAKLDERAAVLDLNRSQLVRRLIRQDLGIASPTQKPLELKPEAAAA